MERARSSFLLLAALLALCQLQAVCGKRPLQYGGGKPGVCPPERYHVRDQFQDRYCEEDTGCPGNKKCCLDNSDTFCKPPASERPGECPPYDESVWERSEDYCTSDSECAENLKCCFQEGGRTCIPSLGEKPGSCPYDPVVCIRAARAACANDSGCPDDQKCCSIACGSDCLPPRKEGFCPPNDVPPGHVTTCDVRCDDCNETQGCCPIGCSRRCRTLSKEKPGFCPYSKMCIDIIPPFACESDLDCPNENEKCCVVDCRRQCVPLLEEKPGVCPVPLTSCLPSTASGPPICSTDYHCDEEKKCCIVDCSPQCITPILPN